MELLRLTQCPNPCFSPTLKVKTSSFPRTQIIQAKKATQHKNEIHINNTNTTLTLSPILSSSSSFPICGFGKEKENNNNNNNKNVSVENLDEWIRDSVSEIVRNIGDAPFLMQVYSKTKVEVQREKENVDVWASVKRRWKEGCPIPDGVILVEQLDGDKDDGSKKMEDLTGRTREWGVLIQGRGIDCPSCYILKTCRVLSSIGFCTHFCLVRAKCFGETAELQLQNSWNGISN